jgi:hypothetical protein
MENLSSPVFHFPDVPRCSRLLKIPAVLVRFDHSAQFIEKANQSTV